MKVSRQNTHCEASLLLQTVFQPTPVSPQNLDPKIDSGTPLIPFFHHPSVSPQVILPKLLVQLQEILDSRLTANTLDGVLFHQKRNQRK